jgi:hypothetical protein
MMHGQKNIKICDAKQVYHYKNIKFRLYTNNAAIGFNKTCKAKHLTPTYASIKIKGDNPRCQKTKNAAIRYRINQKAKVPVCQKTKNSASSWSLIYIVTHTHYV